MPIALRSHWLWVNGRLYQGFFLFRRWAWHLIKVAEAGVQRLLFLNEEAAWHFAPHLAQAQSPALPDGVDRVDSFMGWIYEQSEPARRLTEGFEVLQLPGNVFAAVARTLERCYVPGQLLGAATPSPAVAGAEPGRPANPTVDYCLVPPNRVRWEGEVEVQQRLWHLLGILLQSQTDTVKFDVIEETLYPGKDRTPKRVQNDVSALNECLLKIRWPMTYRTRSGHVIIDRHVGS
jgi:hypothetical protein